MFRSETIGLYCVLMARESAWEVVNELGNLSRGVHFVDCQEQIPQFNRAHSEAVDRCSEALKKVFWIETEMSNFYAFHNELLKSTNAQKNIWNSPQRHLRIDFCGNLDLFHEYLKRDLLARRIDEQAFFLQLENEITGKHKFLQQLISNFNHVVSYRNVLIEQRIVLLEAISALNIHSNSPLFSSNHQHRSSIDDRKKSTQIEDGANIPSSGLRFIGGVIDTEDQIRFNRAVFRATRGNIWSHFKRIENSEQQKGFKLLNIRTREHENNLILNNNTKELNRTIFILGFASAGDTSRQSLINGSTFENKLRRICDAFQASLFPIHHARTIEELQNVESQIIEQNKTLTISELSISEYFNFYQRTIHLEEDCGEIIEVCSYIEYIRLFLHKERAIQVHLNYLVTPPRINNKTNHLNNVSTSNNNNNNYNSNRNSECFAKALIWIPEDAVKEVEERLLGFKQKQRNQAEAAQLHRIKNFTIDPPTKFKQSDLTESFQLIVNTYGIPRYKEINPAYFCIITFPFLFGVMFGDIGHGLLLLAFGLYLLTLSVNPKQPSSLDSLIQARYLITLMGFFALFNGLIYNDFMSISLNLFNSCYTYEQTPEVTQVINGILKPSQILSSNPREKCTYVFGVDPIWGVAHNKLSFYNSLKMKTSVIFGVLQMMMGLILRGLNAVHSISSIDLFFEFIPQMLFLSCTFGYMVFLIIMKWLTDFSAAASSTTSNHFNQPPSILTYMLDFGLSAGGVGKQNELYPGQSFDQRLLLGVALISIPLMLFPKPIINHFLRSRNNHQIRKGFQLLENDQADRSHAKNFLEKGLPLDKQGIRSHDFSEDFVHQLIESIEFVLGSISHTASYLRLWALSLAHSQLAEVFFNKTLKPSLESGSAIGIIIGFIMFAMITFAVLMCMDVLECFLHALRLHWVEFQSKFFKADGYAFSPFSISNILKIAAVEQRY